MACHSPTFFFKIRSNFFFIGASRSEPHTSAVNGNFCVCVRMHGSYTANPISTPCACRERNIFEWPTHMLLKMRKKAAEC